VAKDGEQKVGRTCTYVRADGRYVPGVIRADNGATVDLEVFPLHDPDTHAAVSEMSSPEQSDVWLPGSRYRYV